MFRNLNKRDKLERWLDCHNHKFELIRTVGSILGGLGGALAILKILGVI